MRIKESFIKCLSRAELVVLVIILLNNTGSRGCLVSKLIPRLVTTRQFYRTGLRWCLLSHLLWAICVADLELQSRLSFSRLEGNISQSDTASWDNIIQNRDSREDGEVRGQNTKRLYVFWLIVSDWIPFSKWYF